MKKKNKINIFIKNISDVLKRNGKTIKDIKYVSNISNVSHWISWELFIKKELKKEDIDTINIIIVGDNWWIDRTYEGAMGYPCWNFRTMPKCLKYGYEQYRAYKRIFK